MCSKLTIKTPERRHGRRSGVFIVNYVHISHLLLLSLMLTLNQQYRQQNNAHIHVWSYKEKHWPRKTSTDFVLILKLLILNEYQTLLLYAIFFIFHKYLNWLKCHARCDHAEGLTTSVSNSKTHKLNTEKI